MHVFAEAVLGFWVGDEIGLGRRLIEQYRVPALQIPHVAKAVPCISLAALDQKARLDNMPTGQIILFQLYVEIFHHHRVGGKFPHARGGKLNLALPR